MTLIEKIQCRVTLDGECWQWHGCMQGAVPMMKHGGKVANVRRLVLIEKGVPMTGFIATYTCGNPACVNPEHTGRSTRAQMNRRIMADMNSATNTLRIKRIADVKRRTDAKLSLDDVSQIRASDEKHEDLAARYGVSKSLIGRIRRGEMWRTFSVSPFAGLFA
jgi:hypothetical protein